MNGERIHIFGGKNWSGDATIALRSALMSGGRVFTEGGGAMMSRLKKAGIESVHQLNMSGWFGALNISRMLRLLNLHGAVEIKVHTPELIDNVNKGVKLASLPIEANVAVDTEYVAPANLSVSVNPQSHLLVWVGYIDGHSGLELLIDALKQLPDEADWRLRIVGNGPAKHSGPLVRRAKAPSLVKKIEWTGETDDVFAAIEGATAGIITRPEKDARQTVVYKEFSAVGLPIICSNNSQKLTSEIQKIL